MDKKKELLLKLKELADRGIGGEKINAEEKLRLLLKKFNMTLDDLEDERQESTVFTYKNGQLQILRQVLVMVMGYKVEIWKVRGKRNARIVDCTLAQKIEIETALELFFNHYEQELKIFQRAFIQKNRLYDPDYSSDSNTKMTEEDLRVIEMSSSIERKSILKKLQESN